MDKITAMSPYEYERLLVMRWMSRYRMQNHNDYISEQAVFLKTEKPDYLTGELKRVEYRAGMMVVASRLISISFASDYTYHPYAGNWFSNQSVYTSFFDESWIVATIDNFSKVYDETDKRIGVMIFDDSHNLAVVRHAVVRRNREMDHHALAGLLTKAAMIDLYAKHGHNQSITESKEMLRRHAQCVPYESLRSAVTEHLKTKHYNRLPLPF